DVLSFYRRELDARGGKEEADGAVIEAERAVVRFVSPDGPALMTLDRKDGTTTISITARNSEAARKAGVLPTPGQAKLLFGNLTESEAVVTVHKKKIRIGAGVGAKNPDGPTIDLPPGK